MSQKIKKEAYRFLSLLVLAVFACVLLVYRRNLFGGKLFRFLLWDLFLAWIPYGASGVMLLISSFTKSKLWLLVILPLGLLWLVFFPNAPYILTCYAHFNQVGFFQVRGYTFQPWYDFILYSSFILCGVLVGLASLGIIHNIANKYFGKIIGWATVIAVNFLSGWAIYLGRFVRLNSWDVKTPEVLLPYIQLNSEKTFFIMALGTFLMLIYIVIYNFNGGFGDDSRSVS